MFFLLNSFTAFKGTEVLYSMSDYVADFKGTMAERVRYVSEIMGSYIFRVAESHSNGK